MKERISLFKIGGKILENPENLNSTISQLSQLIKRKNFQRIIIISGGGSFANFIRKVYTELKLTDDLAHWMGIISMNYNGLELGKKYSELNIFENFSELKKKGKGICLFLPYIFLKENNSLPHNWQVTSDSIALFIAKKLGLNECFLVKDVDGILNKMNIVIKEISTAEFSKMKKSSKLLKVNNAGYDLKNQSKPIDPYLLTLIEKLKVSCVILNGSSNNQRILDYFDETKSNQEKIYSRII